MKEYLSIGEISALFGLNVQTLYYYDSIGLFKPRERNVKNGRRRYEFDQIYSLATICYMRKLGYSLEEIMRQRSEPHGGRTLESLKQRSEDLHRQWQELFSIDEAIQRKIHFIEKEMDGIRTDEIAIRHYEAREYIEIGAEELLYSHNSFYFYPTIAFYRGDEKYFGAYLYPGNQERPSFITESQIRRIDEGDYLCCYHLGAYETVPDTIERLRASHPELRLDEQTINFNILDQFVENNSEDYITHTQIRILKQ
ncbi:MAG: MerR family transcriptional regulator [Eubacteriales bacterium]|nr:MerR family transcriptional regulator [Eubacteriales bacterium]